MKALVNSTMRLIIANFSGILTFQSNILPEDLKEEFNEEFSDLKMVPSSEDKINLHRDSVRLKNDFKKAIKDYKREHLING
jgi:hypothetical protein